MSDDREERPPIPLGVVEIDILRAATKRIFEHRKSLRTMEVRIGFWPDGLRLAVGASVEVIGWERLSSLTEADLVAAVDRVAGFVDWQKKPSE